MTRPFFDIERYQREIDKIVGLNRDGKSILRLSFTDDVWTHALGERVPRYWLRRTKDGEGWIYEQPGRFVVERRIEREAYWDAHQAARFQPDPVTGEVVDIGPPPEEFYVFDYLIARHDSFLVNGHPQCCQKAWEGEEKLVLNSRLELVTERVGGRARCWGEYREPDESDLVKIRRAAKKMREDKYFNPYAPLTPEQILAIEVEANMDAQRMADEARERERENSIDFEKTWGWKRTNTDAGKRSKFHFLGENNIPY